MGHDDNFTTGIGSLNLIVDAMPPVQAKAKPNMAKHWTVWAVFMAKRGPFLLLFGPFPLIAQKGEGTTFTSRFIIIWQTLGLFEPNMQCP